MKEFYGLSFAEAVKELLGEEGVGETNRRTAKEDAGRQKVCPIPLPGLKLPEKNESCEVARKYLIEQRKLSEQLVDQMIAKGDIYESKNYHNVVFVGRDKEQNPRYAAMRGTDENRYRGEARGSEKAYGFGHIGTDVYKRQDRALLGGIMGFTTDDKRIPDSFSIAEEKGLEYHFHINETEEVDHPNTCLLYTSRCV